MIVLSRSLIMVAPLPVALRGCSGADTFGRAYNSAGRGPARQRCSRLAPTFQAVPGLDAAAGGLPLVVPGIVLLEELDQAQMHGNVGIGADAAHLHADEILGQG